MKGSTRRASRHQALAELGARFRARPGVAVYCGAGASHSWIWFTDLLEKLELFDVRYVTHEDILAGALDSRDLVLVGGGDTYAMAESLGPPGAAALEDFVRGGGLYHGSCAGGYLVLSGVDLEPFTPFSLVEAQMLNVMREPPEPRCLEHKYLAPYGGEWVFHPVYGEVELAAAGQAAGMMAFEGVPAIGAPLFGGPVMSVPDPAHRLAEYAGTTSRAAFPWPRDAAERFMVGEQAVALETFGLGTAVASGPHLEHPHFPLANALMGEVIVRHWERVAQFRTRPDHQAGRTEAWSIGGSGNASPESSLREIKRQVSNARIVGFGLEKAPVTWKIGVKVWEPEKIRMFLDYAWNRLPYMEERAAAGTLEAGGELEALAVGYGEARTLAKRLSVAVQSGQDSQAEALSLLTRLKELTASFLSLYFTLRLEQQRRRSEKHKRNGADG